MSARSSFAVLLMTFVVGCREAGAPDARQDAVAAAASSEVREWEIAYAGAAREDLRDEITMLMDVLGDDTDPYFESRFAGGDFSVHGHYTPGSPYPMTVPDFELSEYRFLPDGTVGKVVLPEAEFPEEYALHRRIRWLVTQVGAAPNGITPQ